MTIMCFYAVNVVFCNAFQVIIIRTLITNLTGREEVSSSER
jgi:hypothetical protein